MISIQYGLAEWGSLGYSIVSFEETRAFLRGSVLFCAQRNTFWQELKARPIRLDISTALEFDEGLIES